MTESAFQRCPGCGVLFRSAAGAHCPSCQMVLDALRKGP